MVGPEACPAVRILLGEAVGPRLQDGVVPCPPAAAGVGAARPWGGRREWRFAGLLAAAFVTSPYMSRGAKLGLWMVVSAGHGWTGHGRTCSRIVQPAS